MARAPFERGMRVDDGGDMVVSKKSPVSTSVDDIIESKRINNASSYAASQDSFDTAIRNIQQIVEASKKAREEREAAAQQREEELAAKRLAAFTPLYERIDTARKNVELIRADLADGVYKGTPSPQPVQKTEVSRSYSGQCASRVLIIKYSDGSSETILSPDTTSPGCYDPGINLGTSLLPDTSYTPPPPATPAVPPAPPPPPPPPPKTAPIDTILFDDDSVPIEIMSDLIFENIGGHELINIARSDTINGQTVSYQPIKNLTSIQQQYNPNNVVALQNTSDKYFANFSIKLETKLPEAGEGPDGAYVYIEDATGDLIVELINLETDEQIEVQISLSGTIYEAEFNES